MLERGRRHASTTKQAPTLKNQLPEGNLKLADKAIAQLHTETDSTEEYRNRISKRNTFEDVASGKRVKSSLWIDSGLRDYARQMCKDDGWSLCELIEKGLMLELGLIDLRDALPPNNSVFVGTINNSMPRVLQRQRRYLKDNLAVQEFEASEEDVGPWLTCRYGGVLGVSGDGALFHCDKRNAMTSPLACRQSARRVLNGLDSGCYRFREGSGTEKKLEEVS